MSPFRCEWVNRLQRNIYYFTDYLYNRNRCHLISYVHLLYFLVQWIKFIVSMYCWNKFALPFLGVSFFFFFFFFLISLEWFHSSGRLNVEAWAKMISNHAWRPRSGAALNWWEEFTENQFQKQLNSLPLIGQIRKLSCFFRWVPPFFLSV